MEKMSFLKRFWGHFLTINKHRLEVMRLCFKCGLIKQGLMHDLSKYSFIEFFSGVKYYQGYRSPIDAEKEDKGYSLGWLIIREELNSTLNFGEKGSFFGGLFLVTSKGSCSYSTPAISNIFLDTTLLSAPSYLSDS